MILGTDISLYQDNNSTPQKVDFVKMKLKGAKFVILRIGQGKYIDPDFEDYYKGAKAAGLQVGGYWLYEYRSGYNPGLSYQVDLCYNTIKGKEFELPIFMDFERPNSVWPILPSRSGCISIISGFMTGLESKGIKVGFYSNISFLKDTLVGTIPSWLLIKPLWLAWYPTAKNPTTGEISHTVWLNQFILTWTLPTLPYTFGWKVSYWQFTDRLKGIEYGVESAQVDGDLDLTIPEEEESILYIPLYPNQYIRTGPSIKYPSVGILDINKSYKALEEELWIKIGPEQWIAVQHDNILYLKKTG